MKWTRPIAYYRSKCAEEHDRVNFITTTDIYVTMIVQSILAVREDIQKQTMDPSIDPSILPAGCPSVLPFIRTSIRQTITRSNRPSVWKRRMCLIPVFIELNCKILTTTLDDTLVLARIVHDGR